jgi:Transposase IS116/IS110/IS902 family
VLLAGTEGQELTTLPEVKATRAAAFAAFSMPIARFGDAEHLYSATSLAPATYQSSTINRRGGISRQGLPQHRDALMSMAWGPSMYCAPFTERADELRTRGMKPMQVRVTLARNVSCLAHRTMTTQDTFDERAPWEPAPDRAVTARPLCRTTATHQPAEPGPICRHHTAVTNRLEHNTPRPGPARRTRTNAALDAKGVS